jgi:hypothetical protein
MSTLLRTHAPTLLALALLVQGCGGADLGVPADGQITVTVSTSGAEPDSDGYLLSLDGLQGSPIDANGSKTLTVPEGSHTLELAGLAPNCVVPAGASQTVQVAAAGSAAVRFDVVCTATAGGITVTTTTTGNAPDPDGYAVTVDRGVARPIGTNASVTVGALPAGDHLVTLSGLSELCTVTGDNPRTVTVPAGDVVEVAFAIVCAGAVGRWTPMTSNTRADLTEVWGPSGEEAFAVGELDSPRRVSSVIMHFDGSTWTRQIDQTDLELRGVWGSSPADVYAVGFDFLAPVGRVLHYDGAHWTEEPGFASLDGSEAFTLESVWGSSANDVFAVGGAFDGQFDRSLIFHFDGSSWQRMFVTGDVAPTLNEVWGASPTDVYAVGRDDVASPSAGVVLHFDGTSWTPVLQQEGLVLNAVWGSSSSNVFTAGFTVEETPAGDFIVKGAVLHYDGTAWTPMALPSDAILDDIWGSSPSDVFAVGDRGTILHFDGTAWSVVTPTTNELLGVWGSSPADVFAVGFGGTILHGTP